MVTGTLCPCPSLPEGCTCWTSAMVSPIIVTVFRASNNVSGMQRWYSLPFLQSIFVSKEKHEHLETRKAPYGAARRRRNPRVREETRNQPRNAVAYREW